MEAPDFRDPALYKRWYHRLRERYSKYFMICFAVFMATLIVSFVISSNMEEKTIRTKFKEPIEHVEKRVTEYAAKEKPDRFTTLLFTNFNIVLLTIIYGVLFGIGSLYFVSITPAALGIFSALLAKKGYLHIYFLGAIFPHGLFEIPALLLAGALGLRLGRNVFGTFMSMFKEKHISKGVWNEYRMLLADGVVIVVICFLLLLLAAFLEAYVTPSWIDFMCGSQGLVCKIT